MKAVAPPTTKKKSKSRGAKRAAEGVEPEESGEVVVGGRDWLKEPVAGSETPPVSVDGQEELVAPKSTASIRDRVRARIKQSRQSGASVVAQAQTIAPDAAEKGAAGEAVAGKRNSSKRRAPRATTTSEAAEVEAAGAAMVEPVAEPADTQKIEQDVHETPTIPIALSASSTGEGGAAADGPKIVESDAQKTRKSEIEIERAALKKRRRVNKHAKWSFPPLKFLVYEEPDADRIDEEALKRTAANLEAVLADFRVAGRVTGICPGPVVTPLRIRTPKRERRSVASVACRMMWRCVCALKKCASSRRFRGRVVWALRFQTTIVRRCT